MIAFVGSVFSPYYAWARRRGPAPATAHCAFNVALYTPGGSRWAMTERSARRLEQTPRMLTVGPSSMAWDGHALSLVVDEVTAPWPTRLRGRVRLRPLALPGQQFALDRLGRHRWVPYAPCARVEVEFDRPGLAWQGSGYFDHNEGDEPLEDGFERWDWSRSELRDGTAILYDVERRGGEAFTLALHFGHDGALSSFEPPPRVPLGPTLWRVPRYMRSEDAGNATVMRTLEDAPFYARSLVDATLRGESCTGMHESLSLARFRRPWVQALLPFRMPRRP